MVNQIPDEILNNAELNNALKQVCDLPVYNTV